MSTRSINSFKQIRCQHLLKFGLFCGFTILFSLSESWQFIITIYLWIQYHSIVFLGNELFLFRKGIIINWFFLWDKTETKGGSLLNIIINKTIYKISPSLSFHKSRTPRWCAGGFSSDCYQNVVHSTMRRFGFYLRKSFLNWPSWSTHMYHRVTVYTAIVLLILKRRIKCLHKRDSFRTAHSEHKLSACVFVYIAHPKQIQTERWLTEIRYAAVKKA